MNVLGLIAARAGSKGVPMKNLRPLGGKPLIGWVCEAAVRATTLSRVICSTDTEDIAHTAQSFGIDAPFLRPPELATDTALIVDVITHVLQWYDSRSIAVDYVALLQPTSPFLLPQDIDQAVQLAIKMEADTVVSGYRCGQRHPSTMFTMKMDGAVDWLLSGQDRMARRQDLSTVFIRSGLIYVFRAGLILEESAIYGDRIYAIEVPEQRALSIDTERDFGLAEYILAQHEDG